jgi:AmmeMemoRadiSam system protein B
MQLPFLKRLLPDLRIVPLLMGYQVRDTIAALGDALGALARDKRILLVASSDLSHYFGAATAKSLDARVEAAVAAFDADRLLALFEEYPEGERGRYVACGGGPVISVMQAARARGASASRVLRYMHSGEISGDNSGVVGYLAAAMGTFRDVD